MSDVVFILGAGASKQAGAPLMLEFLDVARNLHRAGRTGKRKESFDAVFEAIGVLQSVHSKAQLDIQNVESVFAAFEMARTLGRFGTYTQEGIQRLCDAMNDVIVGTLDSTLILQVVKSKVLPAPPYAGFVDLVSRIRNVIEPRQSVAVVTFNYDIAADHAFYDKGQPIDYALGETTRDGAIPVLKLHGSLNWARCSKCSSVIPWTLPEFFRGRGWPLFAEPSTVGLNLSDWLHEFRHCDEPVQSQPVIVPPTWNKSDYHRILSPVWARAAQELSEAESIIVIGYSLPPSDAFFRYLYALGTVGDKPLSRFWVFNPDTTGDVESRFIEVLGPAARQRFQYFPVTFDESIREKLGSPWT